MKNHAHAIANLNLAKNRQVNLPGEKPKIHHNQAFRAAAKILLTPEGFEQIEELAMHLNNKNNGA